MGQLDRIDDESVMILRFPERCRRRAVRALGRQPELIQACLDILAGKMTYPQYFLRALRRSLH